MGGAFKEGRVIGLLSADPIGMLSGDYASCAVSVASVQIHCI